jgi:hypothetical protein
MVDWLNEDMLLLEAIVDDRHLDDFAQPLSFMPSARGRRDSVGR